MTDLGPRARRALLLALGCGLALFLFFQPGNPYDEAEHLHAAWLMTVRGLRPIHDFFEHHPPLLWHVLSVPFRLGMRGPEVLYAARVLVILCAAMWSWTLVTLVSRWSSGARQEKPGAFAFILFALIVLLAQQLFVARPETLAAALLGWSLLTWTSPKRSPWMAAAAGALAALSACASPRFLLFAPVLAIIDADRKRLGAALLGAGATFAAFVAFLCPWPELLFDLRFSALLQQVGILPSSFSLLYLAACTIPCAAIWGMVAATRRVRAGAAIAWAAHGALIWAVCFASAGKYLYAQAFAPALLWTSLFAAWLEAQPSVEGLAPATSPMLTAALLGSLAALLVQSAAASANAYNVAALTAARRLLLDALPKGARVLLLPESHPITVDDASYWGSVLPSDSPGKMCEAVEAYRSAYPDSAIRPPSCDFVADLRRAQPAAVSRDLFLAAPPLQIDALQAELAAHYQVTDALDDAAARGFSANTLFRKR